MWTPDRGLRRRCRQEVQRLGLPPSDVDIHTIRECLEQRRGIRIELTPVPGSHAAHGLWASTTSAEFVEYERDTTSWHQWLIVCHEFSHMMLGHHAGPAISDELRAAVMPDLAGVDVNFVLHRSSYDVEQEQHAEYLATLLVQRIDRSTVLPDVAQSTAAAAVGRLMQTFGDLA